LTRIVKYLIEGFVVALVAFLLPSNPLKKEEILLLAVTAAAVFALLDVIAPSISSTVRGGVGYGIGFKLAGFP
jgi:ABC-type Co2+ transport system permease subunit